MLSIVRSIRLYFANHDLLVSHQRLTGAEALYDRKTDDRTDSVDNGEEFGNTELFAFGTPVDIRQRGQLHRWRARGHEHQGKSQHRVIGKPTRAGSHQVDDAYGNSAWTPTASALRSSQCSLNDRRKLRGHLHWPDDEADHDDGEHGLPQYVPTVFTPFHFLQTTAQLDTHHDYL